MKLQFKHQKFQADAAQAVVDVFAGQPYLTPSYMMDRGTDYTQTIMTGVQDFTGWSNQKIVPEVKRPYDFGKFTKSTEKKSAQAF